VWDANTGQKLREFKGHTAGLNSAAFSPDGKYIVTAGDDNTARLWNAISGQGVMTLTAHTGAVTAAAFSPDGKYIVTAGADASAKVWDVSDGRALATLTARAIAPDTPLGVTILRAAFSLDGKRVLLVTGGSDAAARIYPWELFVPYKELLSLAPTLTPRALTCEERTTYLHETTPCGTPTP
jgi:WD40 repeat protein